MTINIKTEKIDKRILFNCNEECEDVFSNVHRNHLEKVLGIK